MDYQTLTAFFKWCSIINVGLLAVSALMFMLVPDLIYSIHNTMFEITRESYNLAIYSFLGLFKITILVFNIVPYIALRIIGR